MDFQRVYEASQVAQFEDLLTKCDEAVSGFIAAILGDVSFTKRESKEGSEQLRRLKQATKELFICIKELDKFLNGTKSMSTLHTPTVKEIIWSLNNTDIPNFERRTQRLFNNETGAYDHIDMQNAHRQCQIFERLTAMLQTTLNRISLQRIDVRTALNNDYKLDTFSFKHDKRYEVDVTSDIEALETAYQSS
jgi:hypothetical protein